MKMVVTKSKTFTEMAPKIHIFYQKVLGKQYLLSTGLSTPYWEIPGDLEIEPREDNVGVGRHLNRLNATDSILPSNHFLHKKLISGI